MKTFTDKGIEVWLRFTLVANYYQTDGTYKGTAADFKAGWAAVAAAVADNELVKMFMGTLLAPISQVTNTKRFRSFSVHPQRRFP
jgi:hypothetical protein